MNRGIYLIVGRPGDAVLEHAMFDQEHHSSNVIKLADSQWLIASTLSEDDLGRAIARRIDNTFLIVRLSDHHWGAARREVWEWIDARRDMLLPSSQDLTPFMQARDTLLRQAEMVNKEIVRATQFNAELKLQAHSLQRQIEVSTEMLALDCEPMRKQAAADVETHRRALLADLELERERIENSTRMADLRHAWLLNEIRTAEEKLRLLREEIGHARISHPQGLQTSRRGQVKSIWFAKSPLLLRDIDVPNSLNGSEFSITAENQSQKEFVEAILAKSDEVIADKEPLHQRGSNKKKRS
jgi:hypothetical protein